MTKPSEPHIGLPGPSELKPRGPATESDPGPLSMTGCPRPLASLIVTAALLAVPCSAALAGETQAPLPASNYGIRAACPPPSVRHAGCLALQLVPLSAQAKAHNTPIGIQRAAVAAPATHSPALGDFGLRPADLHTAYELPESATAEQTIALIDAYNDPTAEADLATYSTTFGLPECTTANGCFKKVGETGLEGTLPFPKTKAELETAEAGGAAAKEEAEAAIGWGAEISLDIESAHATCPNCHILLVEANTTSYTDLEKAERTAETLGANELSNSWGGPEEGVTVGHDSTGPFNDPKVVITASSGDNGFLGWDAEFEEEWGFTNYPAASPHVVAVGGTRLTLGAEGKWSNETVWNGSGASGGGCSIQFTAPAWQQSLSNWSSIGCADKRVVADVAADADPHSGIAVTDSSSACETEYAEGGTKHLVHWCTYGGTSLSSPIVAAVFALAGGAGGVAYPAQTLYENRLAAPASLHDVTSGSNGECALGFNAKTGLSSCTPAESAAASCESKGSCLAGTGFDGPTGVGTPHGILAFAPTQTGKEGGEEEPPAEEEPEEEPQEEAEAKEQPPVTEAPPGNPVASTPPVQTPPTAVVASIPPVISSLGLTFRAVIALDAHRPASSKIAFSFMLSSAATVQVKLARRVHSHHRTHWKTVRAGGKMAGIRGRNTVRLRGRRALAAGLYRLTVTPLTGRSRSILFHIN